MHIPFPQLVIPKINHKNNSKRIKQEQVTKTFSEWKQVPVGMEPSKTSQTKWKWHHNTFTPSCHFGNYAHHKTLRPLNEYITTHQQGTQYCSLHTLLLIRQPISLMSAIVISKLEPPHNTTHYPACYIVVKCLVDVGGWKLIHTSPKVGCSTLSCFLFIICFTLNSLVIWPF